MVVQYAPDKWAHIKFDIFLILLIMIGSALEGEHFLAVLLLESPVVIFCIMHILYVSRTFYFSKEGCMVCLWRFYKIYKWEEIQTRRVEELGWKHLYRWVNAPSTKIVYFSNKRIKKFSWLHLLWYQPRLLSFFYVHFLPENFYEYGSSKKLLPERERKYLSEYAVNGKEFMARMKEWGVELERKTGIPF